jgi:ABC-type phosphate transport system substrate-binding protein
LRDTTLEEFKMRNSIAMATFMALAAGTVGAGALDSVPHMTGSDTLKELTLSVLSHCTALQGLGNPIGYDGTGSGNGETAMKTIPGTQLIAPMSRPLGSAICVASGSPTAAQRAGAEGMVVALDGVAIAVNSSTVGAEGIDYPGNAADPSNQWRTVLRQIYFGMDPSVGSNVFARDCNSAARLAIVNNWDNVFHGTVTSCTDSHPSVPGTGSAGYDQNNTIVEPGVRHAFRRDDASGTTDVFLAQLGLSGVNFAQAAPANSTTAQANVYRALAGSPFCNNKRPEDKWNPTTLPTNTVQGFNVSQIPEVSNVGVPAAAGTGLGYTLLENGGTRPSYVMPYFNEYSDEDPIRRKCVGRGSNANAALPMEQVCSADGMLGVVLPISIPALPVASLYPTVACDPNLGFFYGPAFTRPNGDAVRCPNGDVAQNFQCLLPVRSDGAGGVRFDCINPPGNVPLAIFDTDGNGSIFPDAPGTDGRSDVDGRVYNLAARAADGTLLTESRANPNPNPNGTSTPLAPIATAVAGAFWRIHTTRSLLLPPAHTTNVCQTSTDDTTQIGCLTTSSPCSIGYAGREAVTNNTGVTSALVDGIANTDANIKALVQGGTVYPLARKLYLNTVQGFDVLPGSSTTTVPDSVPGSDAEEEMAKCYGSLLYNGTIDVSTFGFVHLPLTTGATVEKPLCEDFNGATTCSPVDASNTDACVGNDTIANSNGLIPTSSCANGLKDGDETAPDVCPAARPTCNATTHHCQ